MQATPPPPAPAPAAVPGYPARLDVEYPDRPLNRLTTFFRPFVAIPILIVLATIFGASGGNWGDSGGNGTTVALGAAGFLFFPPLLLILFREKYPRWWFDWNLELARFVARIDVYAALMDDRYPSTDDRQGVALELDYPDARRDLNRWLPLVKWFLAIPHYIILFFLSIAAFFVVVFCWFAILFTGRMPRGAFDFLVGVGRWHLRVAAYAFLLVTDRYPPFTLDRA
jgi:uncharacterized protein DUF4389